MVEKNIIQPNNPLKVAKFMLLLFIIALLLEYVTISDDEIFIDGKHIFLYHRRSALSTSNAWYFVKLGLNVDLSKIGISFNWDSRLGNDWYRFFLTPKQANQIKSNKYEIYKMSSDEKFFGENEEVLNNCTKFYAKFHESFDPQQSDYLKSYINDNLIKFVKISNHTYIVETINFNLLLEIPELYSLHPYKKNVLHNRWNSGFVQKNDEPKWSNSGFSTIRYLQDKSLNGDGQVITVIESGLNTNNSFFYDENQKTFEFDTFINHRKIVRYTAYGNNHDSHDGHGTSVCGVISGKSLCNDGSELYNGVAPESKINLIDVGENDEQSNTVLTYPILKLIDSAASSNSHVVTGSWGSRNNKGQTSDYDQFAKTSPNRVLVFSAGNDGLSGIKTVSSPSDGKNVICVGALDESWATSFENESLRIVNLKSGNTQFEIEEIPEIGISYFYSNLRIDSAPISSTEFFITANDFCSLNPMPKYLLYVGASKPNKCPTKLKIPIFYSSDTSLLSLNTPVTVTFSIPGQYSISKVADTSSQGPNWIGIQKPDVVAPGTNILSAKANSGTDCLANPQDTYSPEDSVSLTSGTSVASAFVAGAAAQINQYFMDGYYPTGSKVASNSLVPGGSLIRALIVASADPLEGETRSPNYKSGHGVVNIANVLTFDKTLKIVKEIPILSGKKKVANFFVSGANQKTREIRIAMAYSDSPSTSDIYPLSIDINFFVILPNKTIIYGNHRQNNNEEHFATVEKILLLKDEVAEGTYEIHVVGGGSISGSLSGDAKFSLCLIGPIDDKELSFSETENQVCTPPFTGVNCQIQAIELGFNKTSTFTMFAQVPTFLYFYANFSFSKLTIHLQRSPNIASSLVHQYVVGSIPLYATSYNMYITTGSGNANIGLPSSLIPRDKLIGYRIQNPSETNFQCEITFTVENITPVATKTPTPDSTIKPIETFGIAFGYSLFLVTTIIMIVFIVLYLNLKPSVMNNQRNVDDNHHNNNKKKSNAQRNAQRQEMEDVDSENPYSSSSSISSTTYSD